MRGQRHKHSRNGVGNRCKWRGMHHCCGVCAAAKCTNWPVSPATGLRHSHWFFLRDCSQRYRSSNLGRMRGITTALFVSALLLTAGKAAAQEELTCEDYRCEFQQRLETECPCTGQPNHGPYVSCVAHIVNDLVA